MWLLILPMILMTLLVPFILLAQDMRTEQDLMKGTHLAMMLQIYHEASVSILNTNPPSGGNSWANNVKSYLPPNIKSGKYWAETISGRPAVIDSAYFRSGDSCEVISFIKTNEDLTSLRDPSSAFSKVWREKSVMKAGIYNFSTKGFIDFTGNYINLSNFQPQLPAQRNGAPIMYTKRGC